MKTLKLKKIKETITITRIRNFVSAIFNNSVNIIIQLVMIPIFISTWGKNNYGEWLILTTIPAYLTVSDLGVNVTTTTEICSLVAQNRHEQARSLYQSAFSFFTFLSIIFILLYLLITFFLKLNEILGVNNSTEFQVELTLFLLIICTFISHFLGISLGIYRSEGRYDKYQSIMSSIFLLEGVSTLFCLLLGGGIIEIATSYFFIRFCITFFVIMDLKKKYQWFNIGFNSIVNILPIIPTSIYYTAYTTGYSFIIQGTSFLVGKNLGPSSLVTYNTVRTLVSSIRSFSSIFYGVFLPEYTILISQQKYYKAKKVFYYVFIFTISFSFFLLIIYLLLGNWFLKLWTHGKITPENPFYTLMLCMIFVNTLSNCASNILNATNYLKIVGFLSFLLSIISLLVINFIKLDNISQVALVTLVFETILFIFTFSQAVKIINGRIKS